METVAQMFAGFRALVIPATAPPIQVQECRRAFYAGVTAVITALQNSADDASADDLDRDVTRLMRELTAFAAIVGTPAEPGA